MNKYIERVLAETKAKNATEPEFLQTVEEVFTSLAPVIEAHPEYEKAALLERMVELLGAHTDYSLFVTLKRLQGVTETNPHFERVLKNNAECDYCRSYVYENAKYLYLPEMRGLFDEIEQAVNEGREPNRDAVKRKTEQIKKGFFETPLAEMQDIPRSLSDILKDAARDIAAMPLPLI